MNPGPTNARRTKRTKASTVKQLFSSLLLGLLSVWLIGCAGKAYKDDVVALIRPGVTSEAQLLAWFGPATARTLYADGDQLLVWDFKRGTGDPGRLQVRLDPEAKVVTYSGSAHHLY